MALSLLLNGRLVQARKLQNGEGAAEEICDPRLSPATWGRRGSAHARNQPCSDGHTAITSGLSRRCNHWNAGPRPRSALSDSRACMCEPSKTMDSSLPTLRIEPAGESTTRSIERRSPASSAISGSTFCHPGRKTTRPWDEALRAATPDRDAHRALDITRRRVVEDVVMQDSKFNQLIQAADLARQTLYNALMGAGAYSRSHK